MQYIYYYNRVQYVISKCNSKYQHQLLFLQYYYYTTNAHVRDNKQDRIEILSLASLTLDSQARTMNYLQGRYCTDSEISGHLAFCGVLCSV